MSRIRLALGNKPDWVAVLRPLLMRMYDVEPDPLQSEHAALADVVMPLTVGDYHVLRAHAPFSEKALFPSAEAVAICNDKKRFREWFSARFDPEYLPGQASGNVCCIAKPRRGSWGVGTYLIDAGDQQALNSAIADDAIHLETYVAGPREHAFHLLVDHGRALFAAKTTYDHGRAYYVRGRDFRVSPREVVQTDSVPEIFLDVLKALDYSGTACFDYKLDERGSIKIFEVNPRVGGSLLRLGHAYAAAYVEHVTSRRGL